MEMNPPFLQVLYYVLYLDWETFWPNLERGSRLFSAAPIINATLMITRPFAAAAAAAARVQIFREVRRRATEWQIHVERKGRSAEAARGEQVTHKVTRWPMAVAVAAAAAPAAATAERRVRSISRFGHRRRSSRPS